MNIGVCFGGYCPLHQGHLDVIMRAKKENDFTFVFVCGNNNDRGGDWLPLDKRFRIIANFLDDETVKVLKINDDDLGLDQSMSDSNWTIWLRNVYQQMDIHEPDAAIGLWPQIRWYVGEEAYVKQIKRNPPVNPNRVEVILMDRTENLVSGTECRLHPLQNWSKIATPFKAYFSHNILITGTASEGKTTLCQDLGRYFGIPYSYEKGRDNCKIKSEVEFSVKDYMYNLYEQRKYNEELICSPQNPGIFVSDTDNMVTMMYAYAHAGEEGFALRKEDLDLLIGVTKMYAETTKWNKIFLIKPREKGIVDDGERYMADSAYEIRYRYYCKLKELYDTFGYEYEELSGTYYENFCRVRDYIREVQKNG